MSTLPTLCITGKLHSPGRAKQQNISYTNHFADGDVNSLSFAGIYQKLNNNFSLLSPTFNGHV